MKIITFFLLINYCILGVFGQQGKPKKGSKAAEKIPFQTKSKDSCVITSNGHGEIRLRIECKNQGKFYWCEYVGKPSHCRAYNNNPKVFWNQVSLDLKKVSNACEPTFIKSALCPKAPVASHMKKVASGLGSSGQADTPKPDKPTPNAPTKRARKAKTFAARKVKATEPSYGKDKEARKKAEKHCSASFQTLCYYMISIFSG
uniref:Fibroblast growth factor-binding protein 2 n=1 Tax=Geotrypetes seraphini TaxID=260995 RepID=A0A6P8SAE0_GEOSA|nr:fibroblast growth factor-binding protein 2 [Geotrypetes seraphini]